MAKPIAEGAETILRVRVQPRASRNAAVLESDGRIRVALTAPPVEGAANSALTVFVADALGISKRAVTLISGAKSRDKTIRIEGVALAEIHARLFQRSQDAG